ncbi:lactonase family protein [Seonamhaeicola sp. MEBiC1930]|uniref:lactonase family protein n=1 Tax=Seonamhaeicola sp. MEBiC01930 TaxID=2976768 RepID=UPI003251FBCA
MKLKLLIIIFSIPFLKTKAQNIDLYVGTFSTEGIYKYTFNTTTGNLSNKTLAIKTDNPTFITYSKDRKYIYSVNRSSDTTNHDFVSALKINNDGKLTLLNSVDSHGKGPCHISINTAGNKIVISTYFGGTASILNINNDGTLNEASQTFNHNSKTEKSHAHSAQFYNDNLFVSDLGRNAIYQYKLKSNNYILKSETIVKMKGNPGPRHFSLTKDGQYIYIINEYGNSITSVKKTDSGFKTIDEDSTLDKNYNGESYCADIHLSNDERFLYGSNRGENSIAVFKRNLKTGTIVKIQNISVQGNWPRNFTIDPTGKFLLVANRKSNNIAVFKIHPKNGTLTFLHKEKACTPVCLLF